MVPPKEIRVRAGRDPGGSRSRQSPGDPVNILTDSQLVVGIFSQNWKARANLELVMEIRDLLKEFPQLTFAYVRGHNGNQGNELADSLAQEAAESQKGIKSQ